MRDNCIFFFCILLFLLLGQTPSMTQSPGTSADPLVSKSYIDHFIRFRSIAIAQHTSITPEEGALIVVTSGELIFHSTENKTLINLTSGTELLNNSVLPLFNLILVPSGSGITLKASQNSFAMASTLTENN